MTQPYHITSEVSEDTFDTTDQLEDAIRIAKVVAGQAEVGEPISVQHLGKNVRQYIRTADGRVMEQPIVSKDDVANQPSHSTTN